MKILDTQTIMDIHTAYKVEFGPATEVLHLRHKGIDHVVPTAIDLLTFEPPDNANQCDCRDDVYVATAGLSTRLMHGPLKRIEVIMAVDRKHLMQAPEKFRKQFAELALIPFRETAYIAPGLTIENFHLPFFDRMSNIMVADWQWTQPIHLSGTNEQITLLRLCPLLDIEVATINSIGIIATFKQLATQQVRFGDPNRQPIEFESNIASLS